MFDEARAREHALPAHVFAELALEIAQEIQLEVRMWRVVAMPALAGERMMLRPVPVHAGLPEPGSRGDHRDIPGGPGRPRIEHREVLVLEREDPVGIGLEIIDQPHLRLIQRARDHARVHVPHQVRCRHVLPADDRPRHPEACADDRLPMRLPKEPHDRVQTGMLRTPIPLPHDHARLSTDHLEQREPSRGPPISPASRRLLMNDRDAGQA